MIKILDKEYIEKVLELVDNDQIRFHPHLEKDLEKQNFLYTKKEIKSFFKNGKYYLGKELYPIKQERHDRKYCIAKRSLFTFNLILIWFEIIKEVLVIRIQPLNRNSNEGKIYYNKS